MFSMQLMRSTLHVLQLLDSDTDEVGGDKCGQLRHLDAKRLWM